MEIEYVTEIIGVPKITKVPDMPRFIEGVINLRGRAIPVADVRSRFGMEEVPYDERTCIVVIHVDNRTTGLIVDRVNEVSNIPHDQIEPAHGPTGRESAGYTMGIGKTGDSVKTLLNVREWMGH